jgi:hypothetical protein
VIVTEPARVPVALGVKVTATVQAPNGTSGVRVEQVVAGSNPKSPPMERDVIVKLLDPVLVRVADCAPLVEPNTWLPNVSVDVDKPSEGAIPVPLSVIV